MFYRSICRSSSAALLRADSARRRLSDRICDIRKIILKKYDNIIRQLLSYISYINEISIEIISHTLTIQFSNFFFGSIMTDWKIPLFLFLVALAVCTTVCVCVVREDLVTRCWNGWRAYFDKEKSLEGDLISNESFSTPHWSIKMN